ncbi:hypothetical protein FACS1894113_2600 [Alphaproteobacteria bacterium]|nr:hypothetical protein FACS1894113_2600 [Alphaproteobacteria bacterium]
MKLISVLLLFLFFLAKQAKSSDFSFEQLPVSDEIERSMPHISSKSFIIINKKTRLVLYEKLSKITYLTNINSEMTIYDMCCLASENFNSLKKFSTLESSKFARAKVLFFSKDGNHCAAVVFTNSFSEEFSCVLAGAKSMDELEKDISEITIWLEQFYSYKTGSAKEKIATIPVFYGQKNQIEILLPDDHFVLASNKCRPTIKQIILYKTMIAAPIAHEMEVGTVSYETEIFKNKIVKKLSSNENIKRTGRLKIILDSISYIIFGRPFGISNGNKNATEEEMVTE